MKLSLKTKILLPIAIAALALITVGVLSGITSLKQVTDQRLEADFSARIYTLRAYIASQQKALDDTQMATSYDEQYREETLKSLRIQYFKDNPSIYPFILNNKGEMILHPVIKVGDNSLKNEPFIVNMMAKKTGMQEYSFKGSEKWMMFDTDPRWEWHIGYAVSADEKYQEMNKGIKNLLISMGIVSAIVVALLFVLITKWVTNPITKIVVALKDSSEMPSVIINRNDELGLLAKTITDSTNEMKKAQEAQVAQAAAAEATIKTKLNEVLGGVTKHSETLRMTSSEVASSATQVSAGVNTVASSTEEMAASSREISTNTSEAAKVTKEAAEMTKDVNAAMSRLGQSNQQIDTVVQTIQKIASQTNLLALNATIEAARAGESGRGFAVVASEVKALARQTAAATEDIANRIKAVQNDTNSVNDAIKKINDIIARINQIQQTIASAVEEQSATTGEMSRSISEAASGTNNIAKQTNELASLSAKLLELVQIK
jgi:methyl-accepting chemotaxis protein